MEYLTLTSFCLALFACLLFDVSILWALLAGLFIFFAYSLRKGYSFLETVQFSLSGVKTVKNILITFFLIGMLTALWRDAGTLPVIVCFAAQFIHPSMFLLMTFLLNCLISFLTGTAFGTAATMGVICSTMGAALGISPLFIGGAVLSGVYFGDRCSPVSTSALLTATLTRTDIFENIKGMLRTAAIPFLLSCVLYTAMGLLSHNGETAPDLTAIFSLDFTLSPWAVLPALVLLALSLCKVNVKAAMTASIATALPISILLQHTPIETIPALLLTGYTAPHSEVAIMLNGGGITSILKVAAIVCLSSAFSGIFQNTGLLENVKHAIQKIAKKTNAFLAILLTSIMTSMIACNQTLAIILTDQLANEIETDKKRFAIALENSVVVVAPLIPWSIAGGVPLATIEAPTASILFACFLYLLPLWECVRRK